MSYMKFELEIYAACDAEADLSFNYMFSKKMQFSSRKRRASKLTNVEDKNEYYRMYNKHYAILRDLKIDKAKKFLRSEGYTVMEKDLTQG